MTDFLKSFLLLFLKGTQQGFQALNKITFKLWEFLGCNKLFYTDADLQLGKILHC